MTTKDLFSSFANRVVHAARMGKLPEGDIKTLERLLVKTRKKNLIISRALLGVMSSGMNTEKDSERFADLLDKANQKIEDGKTPFSTEEKEEIVDLFRRHSLSTKAAKKFIVNIDELMIGEIRGQISGKETKEDNPESKERERQREQPRLPKGKVEKLSHEDDNMVRGTLPY